jgi:hypothetical protein
MSSVHNTGLHRVRSKILAYSCRFLGTWNSATAPDLRVNATYCSQETRRIGNSSPPQAPNNVFNTKLKILEIELEGV